MLIKFGLVFYRSIWIWACQDCYNMSLAISLSVKTQLCLSVNWLVCWSSQQFGPEKHASKTTDKISIKFAKHSWSPEEELWCFSFPNHFMIRLQILYLLSILKETCISRLISNKILSSKFDCLNTVSASRTIWDRKWR